MTVTPLRGWLKKAPSAFFLNELAVLWSLLENLGQPLPCVTDAWTILKEKVEASEEMRMRVRS